ncbi:MAG: DUF4249 family protein [Gracilimonas sp.]|uniref:hypothetical protein n=1 Tax=Gracilimonas TaxID=649462 RepID=UPI001B1314C9|nr:hypothetical protein [Gracilimonas sp.]MBO6584512.1 DUF4249 family protein [Gracilimonas sp.]MBO6616217.1 DUF4249 family protein [Gracilimonas sp.]
MCPKKFAAWFVFSLLALLVAGCDNSLEPLDKDTGVYSVYGTLDLNNSTNEIRIRDLNVPFTEEATTEIDATVTLENLNTGFVEALNFERFFEAGVYHHNFIVTQNIEANTAYQLTVTRSDGEQVTLTTTTPTYPAPVAEPVNEQCYTPVEVTFDPVYESTIAFFIEFQARDVRKTRLGPYVIRNNSESANEAATYTFTPVDLMKMVPGTLGRYRCTDLVIPQFEFYYAHYSPGFYESIIDNPFNAFESTQRFGAYYEDQLIIPIDDSRVCPPDCVR